ncbi:YcnI family protein [Cellulomonas sp. RIT-PI-Y]|uniref:YcnI family copper-binding membrane protein n=1 Tax=Cellulomonas sp. RIT-PI-Y TaxID=3035297 RepID=UPI0021D909BC|nr:YcnI family protein [Cellulomonas sp. RIT-PI-Y]
MTTHRTARLLATTAATGAVLALTATAASAHVHITPDTTAAGSYAILTVRVPNESPDAATVGVTVDLPTDTPLTYVATEPVPGWTAEVITGALPEPVEVNGATLTQAPLQVVWTATDGGIGDGEFQQFELSTGPLPEAGIDLVLPTHQAYSDGSVVDWDEVSTDGTEPESPAPEFTTTAAVEDDSPAAEPTAETTTTADGATTTAAPDPLGRWLGGLGLLAGVAALALVLTGRARRSS